MVFRTGPLGFSLPGANTGQSQRGGRKILTAVLQMDLKQSIMAAKLGASLREDKFPPKALTATPPPMK